jgi:hypothetical protein
LEAFGVAIGGAQDGHVGNGTAIMSAKTTRPFGMKAMVMVAAIAVFKRILML